MRILRQTTRCLAALLIATAAAGPALAQQRQPQRAAPARPAPAPAPPPVAQEAPAPAVQPAPALPEPRQRRIALPELGLEAGAPFGPEGRDLFFPVPRDLPGLAGRLSLVLDLAAPFPARHAVELRANGRLLTARAFEEGQSRLAIDLAIPPEDLAREPDALRLNLRLVEQPGPAAGTAVLRAESHLALLLPDGAVPSVAAMLRLLPGRVMVLTRPGGMPPAEAAAALRVALALARSGREVRIAAAAAPEITRGPGGTRIWETGAVVIGATPEAAAVVEVAGLPVLAIGGPDPEAAARLLEGPWRAAAGGTAIGTAIAGPHAATPAERPAALPFSALRGALLASEAARAAWSLDFSTRDLPPGTRPQAVEIELRAPPEGGRAVASALLNEVLLGAGTVPADGRLRLVLPVPPRLVGLDNRIAVTLHRAAPGAPAQLLPTSTLRLGPAPAPAEFLALPPAFADGLEVMLEGSGGTVAAEALSIPLWVLRALAPPGAPIAVTPVEPGATPRPRGPFLAATREPPAGSAPRLRFDAGRIRLADRGGARLMEIDVASPLLAAQLLEAEGRHGVWLRAPDSRTLPFLPPPEAPRLDRGDIALLDRQGVALAWTTPIPALVAVSYPEARSATSSLLVWRPWVVGALWFAGLGLVIYAFARPRRLPVPG